MVLVFTLFISLISHDLKMNTLTYTYTQKKRKSSRYTLNKHQIRKPDSNAITFTLCTKHTKMQES